MSKNTVELQVEGMHCASCVGRVEQALTSVAGVTAARVSLDEARAVVTLSRPVGAPELVQAVDRAGFHARPIERRSLVDDLDEDERRRQRESAGWRNRFLLGTALTVPLVALEWGHLAHEAPWLPVMLAGATLTLVGWPFLLGAWRGLVRGAADMDALVALGSTAAFAFGAVAAFSESFHLHDGPLLVTIISLGKWLESRARGRTGSAIRELMRLAPVRAVVIRDDKEVEVAADEVRPGDLIVVRPGSEVPADGAVEAGASTIDESWLTGESLPVEKAVSAPVFAGTLNGHGLLRVRVTSAGAETRLARTVALVREAQATKAPVQRLADRIAGRFVPFVLALALISFLGHGLFHSWERGVAALVAVLVVACPCALGLATPTALVVGMGAAARRGLLFRSASDLERLASVDVVLFDKTGTLTEGRPEARAVLPAPGQSANVVLEAAAFAEGGSEHPLARAVVRRAEEMGIHPSRPDRASIAPGGGVRAEGAGKVVFVGTLAYLKSQGVEPPRDVVTTLTDQARDATLAWVAGPDGLIGAVAFQDAVKPGAAEAIRTLTEMNVEAHVLTGDRQGPALVLAGAIGLPADHVQAELLPEDKARRVHEMRETGRIVAFAGDGVNDAAALAAADVGLAMGSGADAAKAAGGVVLVRADPRQVGEALELARRVLAVIRQNLGWAFGYNALLLPAAVAGWLPHVWAAAAMALSSVSVVGNSLRLGRTVR